MTERQQSRLLKPLYLDSAAVSHVDADGPALRIQQKDGVVRHFPLIRLSRLVVRGSVDVSGDAVLAILRAGLSMTWLLPDQTLAGQLMSASPMPDDSLTQRLDDLHALTDLKVILENWRLSRLRRALMRDIGPYVGWVPDLRARTLRNAAARRIRARTGLQWQKEIQQFRPLLRSVITRHLRDAGVAARWMDPGPQLPDLAGLMAGILETTLWRIGLELRETPDLAGWKKRIAFFESHARPLERHAHALVEDLARHLFDVPLQHGAVP